jgi:hypothetical protein
MVGIGPESYSFEVSPAVITAQYVSQNLEEQATSRKRLTVMPNHGY